jgi:predicted RNA binding protein YcfA (HicA-like mRNA interferase family)
MHNWLPVAAHNGPNNGTNGRAHLHSAFGSGWRSVRLYARYTGSVKVRDIIRMVEQDEWNQVRQKGSHRQYHHPSKAGTVTIAGHPSMDLDPKTERSILKQAGLNQ